MSGVTLYQSSDVGAPVIDGTPSGIFAVLDGCLVTGYEDTPPAGWSKPFLGASVAVYRNAPGSSQRFWRLRDDPISMTSFGAHRAIFSRGFESMSDADTGIGPFPTLAEYGGHGRPTVYHKTGSGPVPWRVLADGKTAYLLVDDANAGIWASFAMGDYQSHRLADLYHAMLWAGNNDAGNGHLGSYWGTVDALSAGVNNALLHGPRNYLGEPGAITLSACGDSVCLGGSGALRPNAGVLPYPNPADLLPHLAPIDVGEVTSGLPRGRIRGLWHWLHPFASVPTGTRFFGAPPHYPGKEFLVITRGHQGGVFCLEVSDTWEG